jgi:hypothetical protein
MRRTCCIVLALASACILVPAIDSSAEPFALDWKVSHFSPASDAAFYEQSTVTLHCEWNAEVASSGNFDTAIDWDGFFTVDGTIVQYFKGKYQPNGKAYIKPGTGSGNDVYGTATNEFHGVAETGWIAKGIGSHSVACNIAQGGTTLESASRKANNVMTTSIVVKAAGTVNPGEFPHPPQTATGRRGSADIPVAIPSGGPALPTPKLSIVSAEAKIDPACQRVARVASVAVRIQNADGPVAAGQGTISVKEAGGAGLASVGVTLPAFGANETRVVDVPVGTSAPFVSALPGAHKLAISLNPPRDVRQPAGTKSSSDFQLPVSFPAGYCKGRR